MIRDPLQRTSRRTPAEVERLLGGYEQSGLSRRQYCQLQGITVMTLDSTGSVSSRTRNREQSRRHPRFHVHCTPTSAGADSVSSF